MSAAASADASRPRLAPWLLAGAVALTVAAGLCVAAWLWLPSIRPAWVVMHSPWADPAVRAALVCEEMFPTGGSTLLAQWARQRADRCDSLAPFLASKDHRTRWIVAGAFSGLTYHPHSPTIDLALVPLLQDPDPDIRCSAVRALSDPASIPALEAHGTDPESLVADGVERKLQRLRAERDQGK